MSIPNVVLIELANALGIVANGADEVQVLIGCSSSGPTATPAAYGTKTGAHADFGEGPLVEAAALSLDETEGTPVILIRTPSSTPGALGTIDLDLFTGTAVPVGSGTPVDSYEGYWICVAGGTIGTDGITFKWSLDDGRHVSALTRLGTDKAFTFPDAGFALAFNPPAAALVALANDIRTQALAHFAATGSVHGAADTTSDDGIGIAATTNANAITLANTLRTGILAHLARGSTVHLAADVTNGAAIPAAATTQQEARTLLIALKAALNAHEIDNTSHTADDTHLVTEGSPAAGTVVAGDIIRQPTVEPLWASADITAAFAALQASQHTFGFVQMVGPVSAADAEVIKTAVAALRTAKKFKWAIFGARLPSDGEADSAYQTSIKADYATFTDSSCAKCAGAWRQTSALSGRSFTRSIAPMVAARAARMPIYVDLARVSDGPLSRGTLYDSNKNPVGHDEQNNPGLDDFGWITLRTFPGLEGEVYITNPRLSSSVGSDFVFIQHRRVMNTLERVIYIYALTHDLNVEGIAGEDGTISEISARDIEVDLRVAIRDALPKAISNPDDDDLFRLTRGEPVLTNGGLLTGSSRVRPLFYIKGLTITTGFKA